VSILDPIQEARDRLNDDKPVPEDQNLLAWTGDPNDAGHVTAHSAAGVGGRVTLVRIKFRRSILVSNIWLGLSGLPAGGDVLANCYIGLYDSTGTLVATSADVSASLTTSAVAKPLAMATPVRVKPGFYYIALLLNGTWTTNSFTLKATGGGVSVNAGLSAGALRYSTLLTGQTTLPASITLSTQATSTINTGWGSQWYGIS
jgi:hypothetical protein